MPFEIVIEKGVITIFTIAFIGVVHGVIGTLLYQKVIKVLQEKSK